PHGAYFGVASLLAGRLMGPNKQGAGVALALSGLTVANVIGVPLGTWFGQAAGWRWAYVAVAGIFAITLALAYRTLPQVAGNPERNPMRELSAFGNPRLWLMLAVGAIGFGGFFAVYSYIAEATTQAAGLSAAMVPWVLATPGIGMTIGNVIAGWASHRELTRTLPSVIRGLMSMLAVAALLAPNLICLFVFISLIGVTTSALIPTLQARSIKITGNALHLGAALSHASVYVGNSIGAAVGGLV